MTEPKALEGMRVVDLTQWEAGTSCTETLAWLGADVMKIEPITGEAARYRGDPDGKDSHYFILLNANKRSATLNLRDERGKELLRAMIRKADVLVENFAPGAIERLGFGPNEVLAINPRIIYARIKGFSPGSPYEHFLCFDTIAQAAGGSMSITGESMDRRPVTPGPHLGDIGTGLHAVIGILAAYVDQQRTGRGQVVEVAMQEAVINYMRATFRQTSQGGKPVKRGGAELGRLFPCKPGGPNDYCLITVNREGDKWGERYNKFLEAIDRKDLIGDPRLASVALREQHAELLTAAITDWTTKHTKREVMATLGAVPIPVGAVFDSLELSEDPFLRERGMFVTIDHDHWGKITMPGSPIHLSRSSVEVVPAPHLGQHTREIYSEFLGLSEAELDELKRDGVI